MPEAFLEWLSSNEYTAYPFKEDVSLRDTTGAIVLPKNLLLDLVIFVGKANNRAYLSKLLRTGSDLSLTFALETGEELGTCVVPIASSSVRQVFSFLGTTMLTPSFGRLVVGSGLVEFFFAPLEYQFNLASAEVEPCCIVPVTDRVESLGKFGDSTIFTGDVKLEAGYNVNILESEDNTSLVLNAGRGLGAGVLNECVHVQRIPQSICTINSLEPTQFGNAKRCNFKWEGSECIEITPYPTLHLLVIHDRCKSCCDCTHDMAVISTLVAGLTTQYNDLLDRIHDLETP